MGLQSSASLVLTPLFAVAVAYFLCQCIQPSFRYSLPPITIAVYHLLGPLSSACVRYGCDGRDSVVFRYQKLRQLRDSKRNFNWRLPLVSMFISAFSSLTKQISHPLHLYSTIVFFSILLNSVCSLLRCVAIAI